MIDDGLRYVFSVFKMLLRNAVQGKLWAILSLGLIVFIVAALFFADKIKNNFRGSVLSSHPYEEVISEDKNGTLNWGKPMNGKRILLILFIIIVLILIYEWNFIKESL